MRPRACAVALSAATALIAAASAQASDHLMLVNEVYRAPDGSQSFLELRDPSPEPFPAPTYVIAATDGSGTPLSPVQSFGEPQPFQFQTEPFLLGGPAVSPQDAPLTMALPAAATRVCFYRNSAVSANVIHCLDFGGLSLAPGQSAQRQSCGAVAAAAPTPDAPNTETGVCSGGGGGGGGPGGGGGNPPPPAADLTPPQQRVAGKRRQDIDALAVTVALSEAGSVTVRASVNLPRAAKVLRFRSVTRNVIANSPAKLRLRLGRKQRRAVKAALARGARLVARVAIVARDASGNRAPVVERRIRLTD